MKNQTKRTTSSLNNGRTLDHGTPTKTHSAPPAHNSTNEDTVRKSQGISRLAPYFLSYTTKNVTDNDQTITSQTFRYTDPPTPQVQLLRLRTQKRKT